MFVDKVLISEPIKKSVEDNSDSLNNVVDEIVGKYTKELDDYIANLKVIAFSDHPDMSNSEIHQSMMAIASQADRHTNHSRLTSCSVSFP